MKKEKFLILILASFVGVGWAIYLLYSIDSLISKTDFIAIFFLIVFVFVLLIYFKKTLNK